MSLIDEIQELQKNARAEELLTQIHYTLIERRAWDINFNI
jgi:hypothetical protein